MLIRPNRIGRRWLGIPQVTPRALFISGADGVAFDFSTPATLFTDAAGTAPLTAPGQTIGLAADKSRPRAPITAYAGVQASAGLRPTYGRGPKSRRNLFSYSEFPNGVTDAPVRGGLVSAAAMAGFSGALAFGHDGAQTGYAYKTLNRTGGLTYTLSAIVEMTDGMGPPVISDTPALSDVGFVVEGSLLAAAVYTITALSGGRYRLSAPKLAVGSGTANFGVVKYGTNTARTFKVTAYQIEVAATASAYQCATTAFDLTEAGFPAYGYARLDGADDKLTVTLPSAITGDLMIFGRSGSWIEAGVTLPSGAFDLGPTGTALTPGVLRALGGLVGAVIIGRSTTTTERALALRYFAARGAAGWLVAGAELISNSAFAANLTGWTNGAPSRSTQTWVAGELKMDATAGDGGAPQTTGTLTATATAGLPYLLEWDTRTTDGATLTGFIAGSQSLSGGFAVGGRSHAVVISATDMTAVAFYGTALRTVYFDNMSLKPLTVGA